MRRVALIPARGGSKRLPRKNIINFCGRPIIAWTIASALETRLFDSVMVSTEDDEIAAIAALNGALVDRRAAGLATDEARVADVCLDFLNRQEQSGKPVDVLCVLYATSPLRRTDDIAATMGLIGPSCAFAMAATHYGLPVHQALKLGKGGKAEPLLPELVNRRAAEIGEIVCDNGSTYAVKVPEFTRQGTFYGPGLKVHVMPRWRSQDIDDQEDLELARHYASSQGGLV